MLLLIGCIIYQPGVLFQQRAISSAACIVFQQHAVFSAACSLTEAQSELALARMSSFVVVQERDHMTGEVERLKTEEAQAALEKKRAAEALMEEVHRSNAEQVHLLVPWLCGM